MFRHKAMTASMKVITKRNTNYTIFDLKSDFLLRLKSVPKIKQVALRAQLCNIITPGDFYKAEQN